VGFYIRKGFNFGPLRLNLSRSGLGASFGVPGARIGVGPRGSYVHLGRGGLYYRQSLSSASQPRSGPSHVTPVSSPYATSLQEIASESAAKMADSSSSELLTELNRVQQRLDSFPIIANIGGFVTLWLLFGYNGWWWMLSLVSFAAASTYARHVDVTRGTAILQYSLEEETGTLFSTLNSAFTQLARCQGVWHVHAAGQTNDWKRNAGVSTLTERSSIRPKFSCPPKVQCNIKVPVLQAGRSTLYFFPDRLLIYNWGGVGAVPYDHLTVQDSQIRFVESGSVPSDAIRVGSTWRFVNRDGGPDRRFNNNRQLPIMLYGQLLLTSTSGLRELFEASVPGAAGSAAMAMSALASGTFPGTHQTAKSDGFSLTPHALPEIPAATTRSNFTLAAGIVMLVLVSGVIMRLTYTRGNAQRDGNSRNGRSSEPAINDAVNKWVDAFRSKDANRLAASYAPVTEMYFLQKNWTREQILGTMASTFARTRGIRKYEVNDVRIEMLPTGRAAATFHKTWETLQRDGKIFSGEEMEKLTFSSSPEGWKIVRDEELHIIRAKKTPLSTGTADLDPAVKAASASYSLDPDLLWSVLKAGAEINERPVSPQKAAQRLRELLERFNFDIVKALAAYKVGPERVEQISGVPPEASVYVAGIINDYNKRKRAKEAHVNTN
jgi:hypothetical protein